MTHMSSVKATCYKAATVRAKSVDRPKNWFSELSLLFHWKKIKSEKNFKIQFVKPSIELDLPSGRPRLINWTVLTYLLDVVTSIKTYIALLCGLTQNICSLKFCSKRQ